MKELFIKVLQNRLMSAFNNGYQNHEFNRLNKAIVSIMELVPPGQFDDIKDELRELLR